MSPKKRSNKTETHARSQAPGSSPDQGVPASDAPDAPDFIKSLDPGEADALDDTEDRSDEHSEHADDDAAQDAERAVDDAEIDWESLKPLQGITLADALRKVNEVGQEKLRMERGFVTDLTKARTRAQALEGELELARRAGSSQKPGAGRDSASAPDRRIKVHQGPRGELYVDPDDARRMLAGDPQADRQPSDVRPSAAQAIEGAFTNFKSSFVGDGDAAAARESVVSRMSEADSYMGALLQQTGERYRTAQEMVEVMERHKIGDQIRQHFPEIDDVNAFAEASFVFGTTLATGPMRTVFESAAKRSGVAAPSANAPSDHGDDPSGRVKRLPDRPRSMSDRGARVESQHGSNSKMRSRFEELSTKMVDDPLGVTPQEAEEHAALMQKIG